jgi:cell division transport system permease protein
MLTSLKRIIFWGSQGFLRNSGASLAVTIVMSVVVFLITFLFFLRGYANLALKSLQDQVALTIYFKPETSEEEILRAKRQIETLAIVEKTRPVFQTEALDIFVRRYEKNPLILQALAAVGNNPFLAHLDIKAKTAQDYIKIKEFVEKSSFASIISHINYAELNPVIEKVGNISKAIGGFTIFLIIIFGIISFLVAYNTTKLLIYYLSEEIAVMRLVGASNLFIRGPLIVQNLISAVVAVIFALSLATLSIFVFSPKLEALVPGLDIKAYFLNHFWQIVILNVSTALFLAIFSSFLAIRKYLTI